MYHNVMKPLKLPPKQKIFSSFDLETYGKFNDFLMGSIVYREDNKLIKKVFYDKQEMIDYMKNHPRFARNNHILLATNLYFDIVNLLKGTKEMEKLHPLIKAGGFLSCKWYIDDKRFIKMFDTLNHLKTSVQRAGELLNLPKLERPSFLGNYPRDKAEWKILTEYNIRDSEITLLIGEFLQENYNRIGCNFKITLPSSSMDLYKRKYLKQSVMQPFPDILPLFYNGYYGGRVEALSRGLVKDINVYDFNSLYPSMMLLDYPNPNKLVHKEKYNRKQYDRFIIDYDGLSNVEMTCPFIDIPYLPVRYETKLIFPYGYIKGWYTHYEIREAIRLGYTLNKIHETLYYKENEKPFRDFIIDMYTERVKNSHSPSLSQFYKINMNALYGKFAQKIDRGNEVRHLNSFSWDEFQKIIKNGGNVIGEYVYYNKKSNYIPSFINPIYSIYTTAYARTHLYRLKPNNLVYWDTDSYFTTDTMETGMFLGELKLEARIDKGLIVKPKFYDRGDTVKIKGCPYLDRKGFYDIINGKPYDYKKYTKFKESIRRSLDFTEEIQVSKRMSLEDNKRNWNGQRFNRNELQVSQPIKLKVSDY